MKRILFLALFLISGMLHAQNSLQHNERHLVTLSLLSPVASYAPRYNAGYMYRFTNRWWAGIEAGYGNDPTAISMTQGSDNNFFFDDYKLWEIRPEFFYSLRNNGKLKHLVSAEFFYIHHTDNLKNSEYNTGGDFEYTYDSANYKRIKTGMNINYSLLFYFTDRFGLLTKTGFGFKHREVRFSNVQNPQYRYTGGDDESGGGFFGISNYLENAGTKTNVNFNFDLKLYYKL